MPYFPLKMSRIMPYFEISDRAQMSKTICCQAFSVIGGRESFEDFTHPKILVVNSFTLA